MARRSQGVTSNPQDLFKLIGATITSVHFLRSEILVGTPQGTMTIKGDVQYSKLSPFYVEETPNEDSKPI